HKSDNARRYGEQGVWREPLTDPQETHQGIDDAGHPAKPGRGFPEVLREVSGDCGNCEKYKVPAAAQAQLQSPPKIPHPQAVEQKMKQTEMQKGRRNQSPHLTIRQGVFEG